MLCIFNDPQVREYLDGGNIIAALEDKGNLIIFPRSYVSSFSMISSLGRQGSSYGNVLHPTGEFTWGTRYIVVYDTPWVSGAILCWIESYWYELGQSFHAFLTWRRNHLALLPARLRKCLSFQAARTPY
jgi:hypothetical protein